MRFIFSPENWEWLFHGKNLTFLLEHFLRNVLIALVAMGLSLVLGLVLALLRLTKNKFIGTVSGWWIDAWRNLPLIFILLYMLLAMPRSLSKAYESIIPGWFPELFQSDFFLAAIIGLTLYNSAVIAEIMRAGIVSLERGQGEAAAALGLPYWKSMRLVVLPQGLRRMVPATVSQLITLTKDTSLTSIIGVQELVNGGQIISNTAGSAFIDPGGPQASILHVFIVVGVMFIAFNLLLSRLSRRLEIKQRERTGTTAETVTG
ncbi:MAG: amino acid ABC transporter permease, partial [Actinobacteria bacterium]|nr:amino acid ABC transporter permease [Actinomycetota bacterium]